jgi:hypothetical protein
MTSPQRKPSSRKKKRKRAAPVGQVAPPQGNAPQRQLVVPAQMPPLPALPGHAPLQIPAQMPPLPPLPRHTQQQQAFAPPLQIPAQMPPLPALPGHAPQQQVFAPQQHVPAPTPLTQPAQPTELTAVGKRAVSEVTILGQPAVLNLVKTKRQSVKLTQPIPDPTRHEYSARADEQALKNIYSAFYDDDGNRTISAPVAQISDDVYELAANDTNTLYLHDPISRQELGAFLRRNEGNVSSQETPDPFAAAVEGDYYHVLNPNFDRHLDLRGRQRRIVINVMKQRIGLRLASTLTNLFNNRAITRSLKQYKVYLCTTRDPEITAKYDKLVVYYATAPGDVGAADTVGDTIAAAAQGAIRPDEVVDQFAPFYSHIGHGLAWAEEPKYFIEGAGVSFTDDRSLVVAQVIADNPTLSEEEFADKVRRELAAHKVSTQSPHRHLVPFSG